MGTFANNEDIDKMLHNVALHHGLHCLLSQKQSSEQEIEFILKVITCDRSIYTMDNPDFIVYSFMENYIGLKKVNSILVII